MVKKYRKRQHKRKPRYSRNRKARNRRRLAVYIDRQRLRKSAMSTQNSGESQAAPLAEDNDDDGDAGVVETPKVFEDVEGLRP